MFGSAILKLTASCNLDCTYCYMFNLKDRTFSRVPRLMSVETALAALNRIERHISKHELGRFSLILHGGEPSLWPIGFFRTFLDSAAKTQHRFPGLTLDMQTNGVLLRPELIRLLAERGVTLGISLDGPKYANDSHRIDRRGRGSYDRVVKTVEALLGKKKRPTIGGFLSVAHPEIPPRQFLDWIADLPIPRVDVLWPIEFNHDNPPWRQVGLEAYRRAPRYGMWFADLFEEWWRRDDPNIQIRIFVDILKVLCGSASHVDSIVNDKLNMLVINTSGAIEYPDYFRARCDGGSRTAYNVHEHDLDQVAEDRVFFFCLNLGEHIPSICRGCVYANLCGGGFLPGRMTARKTLPRERSVLCYDHFVFYSRILDLAGPYVRAIREGTRDARRRACTALHSEV